MNKIFKEIYLFNIINRNYNFIQFNDSKMFSNKSVGGKSTLKFTKAENKQKYKTKFLKLKKYMLFIVYVSKRHHCNEFHVYPFHNCITLPRKMPLCAIKSHIYKTKYSTLRKKTIS